MLSATIKLTNHQPGDLLSVIGALPAGISASAYDFGTGTIVLTGSASIADYQAAIEAIGFSTGTSSLDDRRIEVSISDGVNTSNKAISTIAILRDTDGDGVTDAIDIDDDNDGILDRNEGYAPIDFSGGLDFTDQAIQVADQTVLVSSTLSANGTTGNAGNAQGDILLSTPAPGTTPPDPTDDASVALSFSQAVEVTLSHEISMTEISTESMVAFHLVMRG